MLNKKKYYISFIFLFFLTLFFPINADSNILKKFLSLKNNEVNVRVGPSKKYPIKFVYKKKYLPLEILDKSENWRKVKDFENNSGWIHISQLSNKKSGINTQDNTIIYKSPTIYSKPLVKLKFGRLVLVKKCKKKWCKVTTGNYTGWIFKEFLWGKV
jgi:SH3-like domain-containing protein